MERNKFFTNFGGFVILMIPTITLTLFMEAEHTYGVITVLIQLEVFALRCGLRYKKY